MSADLPQDANSDNNPTTLGKLYLCAQGVVFLPTAAFTIGYTAVGYGETVFRELNNHYEIAELVMTAATLAFCVSYLMDSFTGPKHRTFKVCLISISLATFAVGAVLAVDVYPAAPAAVYLLIMMSSLAVMQMYAFPNVPSASVLKSVAAAYLVNGTILLTLWVIWVVVDDWAWNDQTKAHFEAQMECEHSKSGTEDCAAAFLVWAWPSAIASLCIVLGAVAWYLALSVQRNKRADSDAQMHPALRPMLMMVAVMALGLYISASVAGVQMQLANIVMQFMGLTFLMLLGLMVAAFGKQEALAEAKKSMFVRKLGALKDADWLKGLILIVGLPGMLMMCALSALNMLVRRYARLSCTFKEDDDPTEEPAAGFLWYVSPKLRTWLQYLFSSPTETLVWAHWMGILYFGLSVGVGKLVVLMLSWLNDWCLEFEWYIVMMIVVVFGIGLFLLPPVPGVPVYLFAGVVLVNSLQGDLGYWFAIFITSLVCLMIKLIACSIQQKVFGEKLSQNVAVRKMVGVNSTTIRAIRFCLEKPGLSPAKVAILCGGPDWPTSVLCGILKLPLHECLIGTLPVYPVFLFETVVAGALYLKSGDSWTAAASTMLAVSSLLMGITSLSALYFIELAINNNQEELEKYPEDKEVAKLEETEQDEQDGYKKAIEWSNVPMHLQILLCAGMTLMSISCYIFALFSNLCFRTFQVSDSIAEKLDGSAWNMVLWPGWIAGVLFVMGCLTLHVFYCWAGAKAKKMVADERSNGKTHMNFEVA